MESICVEHGVSEFGCSCVTWGLYFGYFLGFVAVLALIVLPLMNALKSPKELLGSAIGIGSLLIIFMIAYVLSGDEVSMKAAALGTTANSSKLIGAGLITFYFVFVIAIAGLFYSFIPKGSK